MGPTGDKNPLPASFQNGELRPRTGSDAGSGVETSARQSFDTLAASYDAWYATPLGRLVDRLEKETALGLVETVPGGLALDLSCGTGNYAVALARRGFRVVGVDLSEPMLRVAHSRASRAGVTVALVRADGAALPFRAGSLDLVTIVLGLEFVADRAGAIGEARRVLKRGGALIVAILNRVGLWTLWRRLKRRFVDSIWRQASFLRPEELVTLLRAGGFDDLRRRRSVHFLPLSRRRGVAVLERWEHLGSRWMPGGATFVAVAARRA